VETEGYLPPLNLIVTAQVIRNGRMSDRHSAKITGSSLPMVLLYEGLIQLSPTLGALVKIKAG
jgi:hypothetical protein